MALAARMLTHLRQNKVGTGRQILEGLKAAAGSRRSEIALQWAAGAGIAVCSPGTSFEASSSGELVLVVRPLAVIEDRVLRG